MFNFAFWNCAISPPGTNLPVSEDLVDDACKIIMEVFEKNKIGLIALCEVNEFSFKKLNERLSMLGLSAVFLGDETETGSKFDIAVFYIKSTIKIIESMHHTGDVGTSKVKIAQQLKISIHPNDTIIDILISHWPSRLQHVSESFRNECSTGLRMNVSSLMRNDSQVILMGDYNDDPYSQSLLVNLRATNDRSLVMSKPNYWLYNPFWRTLFARVEFQKDVIEHDFGTCYSKSNSRNNWSTFDQIIFSGNFLTTGPWFLKEADTNIVSNSSLLSSIMNSNSKFDHFPIVGCIEKSEIKHV